MPTCRKKHKCVWGKKVFMARRRGALLIMPHLQTFQLQKAQYQKSFLLRYHFFSTKGQIKPKADLRAVDSPKKRTNKFVLFAFLLFTANKTNSFVRFLGESTARQFCFRFYLTFTRLQFILMPFPLTQFFGICNWGISFQQKCV